MVDTDDKKIIHGLDVLIDYYRSNTRSGLQHSLSGHVPGQVAPPETRVHGNENLLHRACKVGDVTVASELLAVGKYLLLIGCYKTILISDWL